MKHPTKVVGLDYEKNKLCKWAMFDKAEILKFFFIADEFGIWLFRHLRMSDRSSSIQRKTCFATLSNAPCTKSNGSCDIKDFGTFSLIFSTSKYFRRKCQPCPSFFSHPNIPDKWKRAQLSLDQMKNKERVKVKS